MQVSYKLKQLDIKYNIDNVRAVYRAMNTIRIFFTDRSEKSHDITLKSEEIEYIFIDRYSTKEINKKAV